MRPLGDMYKMSAVEFGPLEKAVIESSSFSRTRYSVFLVRLKRRYRDGYRLPYETVVYLLQFRDMLKIV
jgi:hypothetical protein